MSLVAFELPTRVHEALEVFRQQRRVLIYCASLPAFDRSRMREHIRHQLVHFLALFAETIPENVSIDNRRGVIPTLLLNGEQIHVSISHTSTISCAALSLDTQIGVDVIDLDDIIASNDLLATAQLYLAPSIANFLANSSEHALRSNFAIEWAKCEASLKCLGRPIVEWSDSDSSLFIEMSVEFISLHSRYVIAQARLGTEK